MHLLALSLLLATTPTMVAPSANYTHADVLPSVSEGPLSVVPSVAASADEHGVTTLRLTLSDSSGHPKRVVVERSSGFLAVDDLAIKYAQNTIFNPEVRNGASIGGEYFLEVEV